MQVPNMIPLDVVHQFDLTALRRWLEEQDADEKAAGEARLAAVEEASKYVYEHSPTKVLRSMRELFPERDHAPTMQEWLAREVKQVIETHGKVPEGPTPGVRIWVDSNGKIQFNPDMVCPARQFIHGVRPKWWSGQDKGETSKTNVGPEMNKAIRRAKRSGWTVDWWQQHSQLQTALAEANAINKRTLDEALGRVA